MRVSGDKIVTTAELMKEFFGMEEIMINNMTEKIRYKIIHNYLQSKKAKKIIVEDSKYDIFKLKKEIYLIPKEIFDENDKDWLKKLKIKKKESDNFLEPKKRIEQFTDMRLKIIY